MKSCLVLLLTALLLTGCWDHQHLAEILYVSGLGVDYNDGEYQVYAQTVEFATIATSERKTKGGNVFSVGKSKGKTISIAVAHLYHSSQRKINWNHIRAVILTEKALKKTKGMYFDDLSRFHEFRMTPWIFGTKEDIQKLMTTKPFFQMSPLSTLLGEPEDNYKQNSVIQPISIHDYVVKLNEPGNAVLLPSISINKETWKKDIETNDKLVSDDKLMYDGVFAIEKENKVEFISFAKAVGLRWMNPDTPRIMFEVPSVVLVVEKPSKIKISYQENTQKFMIKVKFKSILVGINEKDVSESLIRREGEEKIKSEIKKTYLEGIEKGIDVYSLKHELYKSKKHQKAMQEVALTKDSIDIKVNLQLVHSSQRGFETSSQ